MPTTFPLSWPDGWPRTPEAKRKWSLAGGRAQAQDWNVVLKRLHDELARLGAGNIVMSTNQPVRRDGNPYAAKRIIQDPGVAVYFTLRGRQLVMAQDAYELMEDNIRSIALAIEHLRGLERHGGGTMMDRAFAGFEALPPPRSWRDVLEFGDEEPIILAAAEARFRHLAKKAHPDAGGSTAAMAELNAAIAEARRELA
jgi:hypothetical protein